MTRSSANALKLASPSLVDIFKLYLPRHFGWSHGRPKLAFYRGRMGPQKGQKFRKPLRKCEKLFMGGVPAGGRSGNHKANPRDVAMRMKGMRDSSGKARLQE